MTAFRVQFGIGLEWTPWRVPVENFKWTKETADHLRDEIVKVLPTKKSGITQLRVLVIGPKGHGKSSLINSFASISEETKLTACNAAAKESNVTTVYRSYEFLGDLAQLRVCDISGLPKKKDEEMRPFLKDIELLLKGKIKDPYEFTEETISEENEHFVADPSLSEMIHCAIFVFDCVEVYEIHQYYKDSVMTLLDAINKQNIPVMVVLTKADKLSPHVKYDIKSLFRCRLIRDAVDKASKQLTIPQSKIFPVVNFEEKDAYNWKDALPILLVIRSCLLMTRTHVHNAVPNEDCEVKN